MKRLTEDLKRMLNALAMQDVGDFLPMRDKMRALHSTTPEPRGDVRRVALLSNGQDSGETLRYALNACQNQQASLDLVLYGEARAQVEELRQQLQESDIACEIILLGGQGLEPLIDYLNSRHSLVYLVASTDDPLALELTRESSPRQGGRLHLPMVLVDHRSQTSAPRINSVNAA